MRLGVGAALVDGNLVPGDVDVVDGRIAGVGLSSPNGTGIAAPGFVDLQVNGFAGVDFFSADAEGYRKAGKALLACGVTAYQPTFITSPEDELTAALHASAGVPRRARKRQPPPPLPGQPCLAIERPSTSAYGVIVEVARPTAGAE